MSFADWLIVIVPTVFVLWVGYFSKRYIRGIADYLSCGRVCGRYVISVADVANMLAVVTLVAQVEVMYKSGLAYGFWTKVMVPISMLLGLLGYCGFRFRQTRAMSLGQFLEIRYNRAMRIFAATLRTFSETLCNMIVPAISARFFIYLLDLPYYVNIFGIKVSTFGLIIFLVLALAIFILWCGGTVALVITGAVQMLISYPIFAVFVVYLLTTYSWSGEIVPVLMDRVPQESFLDPYDLQSLRDFNIFASVVIILNMVLNYGSWIGSGLTTAGKTAHEQKMAGVLGSYRNGFSVVFYFVIAALILTVLNHQNFAETAREIRSDLSAKIAEEVVASPQQREKFVSAIRKIPEQKHVIGTDKPLSDEQNLDTVYMETAHDVLGHSPEGNAKFQQYRTLYYQLMLPETLKKMLPAGLIGLFALLMLMLMLSTDDSRIFSGAVTSIQDVVLPIYGKSISTRGHLRLLRIMVVIIGIMFFCGSFFMAQLDYINLFCIITTSIWLGGAGPVIVGGLYTRFGTTAGAFSSLFTGIVVSGGGILVQRNWADTVYPWLDKVGWAGPLGRFLEAVSSPFDPYIVWKMDPVKFPINSNELFFISMILGVLSYVVVSLLTMRKPFDLDKMLHRGKYADAQSGEVASVSLKEKFRLKSLFATFIGIDSEYTKWDKVIAWSVFVYSFVYSFLICFVGVVIWNSFSRWPLKYWSVYFLIIDLIVPCIVAVISTVWFSIGGVVDLRQMFRDLKARKDNPLDNGEVRNDSDKE